MSESVVLCEGYYDRAFWAGWLLHLHCTDLSLKPGLPGRVQVLDPWNRPVRKGQYAYHSASSRFVRIFPCMGKSNVMQEAETRLAARQMEPLVRLIVTVDPDVHVSSSGGAPTGLRSQDVEYFLRSKVDPAAVKNADGEFEIDGGATKVALIRWEANDTGPGLPDLQTLERVACAGLVATYPARAQAVQDWLDKRPQPPVGSPKEHAWSFMAGWYAEHGCEDFYANLWRDAAVRKELESRLRASGAWQIAAALAS